jgi:hypothetical protein
VEGWESTDLPTDPVYTARIMPKGLVRYPHAGCFYIFFTKSSRIPPPPGEWVPRK